MPLEAQAGGAVKTSKHKHTAPWLPLSAISIASRISAGVREFRGLACGCLSSTLRLGFACGFRHQFAELTRLLRVGLHLALGIPRLDLEVLLDVACAGEV